MIELLESNKTGHTFNTWAILAFGIFQTFGINRSISVVKFNNLLSNDLRYPVFISVINFNIIVNFHFFIKIIEVGR